MRVKVGRIVDVEADVNLADLNPLDRVIASAINAYHNTKMYQRRFAETEEKRQEQLRKVREALIDNLLQVIVAQLERNELLKDKGDECFAILVEVPARFKPCISDVVIAHEFDAYEITVIPPSKVIAKFARPPYLLHICNRGG